MISGAAVLLLAGIARGLNGLRKDSRRLMMEHMWLLATTLWTRDKVLVIMQAMGLESDQPPPADLPGHQVRK